MGINAEYMGNLVTAVKPCAYKVKEIRKFLTQKNRKKSDLNPQISNQSNHG